MNSTIYYENQYQYDSSYGQPDMASNGYLVAVDDSKIKLPSINSLLSTQQQQQQQQQQPQQQVIQVDQVQPQTIQVQQLQPAQISQNPPIQQESPIPDHPNGIIMNSSQGYYSFQDPTLSYTSPSLSTNKSPEQYTPKKFTSLDSLIPLSSSNQISVVNPTTSPSSVNSFQQVPAPFYPPPPPPTQQQYYYPYQQTVVPPQFPPTPPMGFSSSSMIHPSQSASGYFDPPKYGSQHISTPQAAAAAAAAAAAMISPMPNEIPSMNPILNNGIHHMGPSHSGIPMMAGRPVKPKRKRATPEQTNRLNEVFAETFFPTSNQRMDLAMELGMSPRTVQIWFQNKRQGWRSEHRRPVPREPVPLNTDYLREQHEQNEQKHAHADSISFSHDANSSSLVGSGKVKQETLETSQPLSHYPQSF